MKRVFFVWLISFSTFSWADVGSQRVDVTTVHGSTVSVNTDGGILVHTTNPSAGGGSGGSTSTTTVVNVATVTFNGVSQPVTLTNQITTTYITNPTTTTITGTVSTTLANQVTTSYIVNPTSTTVMNVSTITFNGVAQPITGSISNTGFNVNNSPTVLLSSTGVNASTVAVTQQGTWVVNPGTGTYPITGSINNTGFNVNNIPSVTQSGSWIVSPGTGTYPITGSVSDTIVNVPTTTVSGSVSSYVTNPTTSTVYGSVTDVAGNLALPVLDNPLRSLQEQMYLQQIATNMNTMLAGESENSQRQGFEIR